MNDFPTGTETAAFRDAIEALLGLRFDDDKLDMLADLLGRRVAATGGSAARYLARLGPGALDEARTLAEALTIGETYFFRYAAQFRAFEEAALPACLRANNGRLRILSAGCASGEEAYSLAILLREHRVELAGRDVSVHAIDVNPAALARAARATYSAWSLRETPAAIRERDFRENAGEFCLDPGVQALVSFSERNLVLDDDRFWRPGAFDVIFCRNVMMYFSRDGMSAVVDRLARSLVPGGFLFLGHAETLRGVSHEFHLCHTHETFYYQRKTGAERGLPDEATPRRTPAAPAIDDAAPDSAWQGRIQEASLRIAALADHGLARPSGTPESSRLRTTRDNAEKRTHGDLAPAVEMLRQDRFGEAMDLLQALPAPPAGTAPDPDTELLRAVLLTNSARLPEAERVCEKLLATDDLNAGTYYILALCREHAGDPGAARAHDQTATYLDPTFAMPHLHLGLLARRAGDFAEAERELGLAIRLLEREDASRILLFGGGFGREALVTLCHSELAAKANAKAKAKARGAR